MDQQLSHIPATAITALFLKIKKKILNKKVLSYHYLGMIFERISLCQNL